MKKSLGLPIFILMVIIDLAAFSSAADTIAPTVISTSPAAGATGIAVNATIAARFSELMDPGTVTINTFTLRRGWSFPVLGVVTYSLGTARFDPSSDLAYNTTYTATITTGVKDLAGNAMTTNKTWSFTTRPKPDTTPPIVISTNPADSATNVAVTTSITATFSEAMNPGTITAASFTLRDSGNNPVRGTVTYNGTTATFTPASRLISETVYTATITTEAKDLAGNAVAVDKTWSFTTANKTWTHPASLLDHFGLYGLPVSGQQVAMDDNGNAVIVWQQGSGANSRIFKSEYRNNAWTHPASLTSDGISPIGQGASESRIAMDDNGNAIIVWQQSDGAYGQIFKSEYRNGAWTHPASLADNISPDGQQAYGPQVAMDNNGNAIIVWNQVVGTNFQIFKSEYRNGAWTHPASLTDNISPDGQSASESRIAMDDNGNAIIVWQQSDGAYSQIFKSEYRNGAWTHPASPADNISPDGQDAYGAQVAMDNNGNAIIVWQQSVATYGNGQIFKSEYRSGAWTHPASLTDNINPDGQHAASPQTAMDNNGNAIIVWGQFDGTDFRIFKSEYRNNAWTHPASLADNISPDGQSAYYPRAAMDNNGNAIIVWQQSDGLCFQIFKSEYRNGAWTHPVSPTDNISPDGQSASESRVAMDDNGNAIIVWQQSDGTYGQIFKSEFR